MLKWENFQPGYRDFGRKNRDLSNRTNPPTTNTSRILQREEWRGKTSETEPARLTGFNEEELRDLGSLIQVPVIPKEGTLHFQ